MAWKDLSLREKAAYIHTGVRNGLTEIRDIEDAYNNFSKEQLSESDNSQKLT